MRKYLNNYVSTQNNGFRNSSGIGYVLINAKDNAPREKYIKDCMLKGCLTIALENGGFIENIPVLKHVWDDIIFPELNTQMGSCVLWNNIPKSNLVVIVGVIPKSDEVINRNENSFSLSKTFIQKTNGKNVSNHLDISGDAKTGKINISVDGGEDSGELLINVFNKNKTANLKVNVRGKIIFDSSGGLEYKDAFKNEIIADKNNVQINAKKKVNLGKGKEGITLGKQANDMFDEFINEVASITVTTALGTMPILNLLQVQKLKTKTAKIVSKYSFTD